MRPLFVVAAMAALGGCDCRTEPTFVITFEPQDQGAHADGGAAARPAPLDAAGAVAPVPAPSTIGTAKAPAK